VETIFHFNGHKYTLSVVRCVYKHLAGVRSMSSRFSALIFGFILIFSTHIFADDTFDQDTILTEASSYLGSGAEGLASVIEKVFEDHGEPAGYIKGQEASGAWILGLRYGDGELFLKNGYSQLLHWQGPSVGFDWGGNAAKVFTLVYHLPSAEALYMRYPGVDGSLYFVGGVGVNYLQRNGIILAPIRVGLGWRAGANVGYMKVTPQKTWNPF